MVDCPSAWLGGGQVALSLIFTDRGVLISSEKVVVVVVVFVGCRRQQYMRVRRPDRHGTRGGLDSWLSFRVNC